MRKPSAPHPPTAWATPHSGVLPTPQVGRDQLPLSHKPTASVREPLPSMTEATSMVSTTKTDHFRYMSLSTHLFRLFNIVVLRPLSTGHEEDYSRPPAGKLPCSLSLFICTCASSTFTFVHLYKVQFHFLAFGIFFHLPLSLSLIPLHNMIITL